MNYYSASSIKELLLSTIHSIFEQKSVLLNDPDSSFSRVRKISFEQAMLFPMLAGSENVDAELLDFFGEDILPLQSAMIQRRNQIKPAAFKVLFSSFTQQILVMKTFHGYQLIACDGSRLNLPYHPSDPETFIKCIEGRKGLNQMHMNCLYDPLNDIFIDVELQGIQQMDEKAAFTTLLKRQADLKPKAKQIFIADRGYASYNIFAHAIHNNQLFLIRVPESFARNICKNREDWLADPCADETVIVNIGRRNTKEKRQLTNYHHIQSSGHYDFLEKGSDETDQLHLRVLKFPISEVSFEYIVTNIPKYTFSLSTVKELYNLRWKEETAFRHLKYAGNMVHIHSLKKDHLLQEIYGKLTLYNFSSFIASVEGVTKKTDKYTYTFNHTQVQKICIRYLRGTVKNVKELITRYLVPIRPGRSFERELRRQPADTLAYR